MPIITAVFISAFKSFILFYYIFNPYLYLKTKTTYVVLSYMRYKFSFLLIIYIFQKLTVNTIDFPSGEFAVIFRPDLSAISFAIESPMPCPPVSLFLDSSAL